MSSLFDWLVATDFMPHGHCYFWEPDVLWLLVVSDGLIGLAYLSIPVSLAYFARRRSDLPYAWLLWMFGAFILFCGTTHFLEIWTTWSAQYRIEGVVKAMTAVVSLATAVLLIPVIPRALELPSLRKAYDELSKKTEELEVRNLELERFNRAAIDREHRMIELKARINSLSERLGETGPFDLAGLEGEI